MWAPFERRGYQRFLPGARSDGLPVSARQLDAPGVWALAADTDGIDGVEDNAGALVAPDTLARAAEKGIKLADHLARNDACTFFEALDDLVVSGPTHTNVNDFRAVLIV